MQFSSVQGDPSAQVEKRVLPEGERSAGGADEKRDAEAGPLQDPSFKVEVAHCAIL